MKLKIKSDITSAFKKMLKEATKYCNTSEKSYSYPFSVKTNIKYFKVYEYLFCNLFYSFNVLEMLKLLNSFIQLLQDL